MTLKSSFVCRSRFFAVQAKDWRLVRARSQFVYKKSLDNESFAKPSGERVPYFFDGFCKDIDILTIYLIYIRYALG